MFASVGYSPKQTKNDHSSLFWIYSGSQTRGDGRSGGAVSYIQTKSGTPRQLDFVRALHFPLWFHLDNSFMSHISYIAWSAIRSLFLFSSSNMHT